jgi:predicted N-acetyltransferase YhbS
MNITIKPEEELNFNDIRKVNHLAFGHQDEGVMVEKLRDNPNFISELSLVAILDSEVVGHILLFPIEIKNGSSMCNSLFLGPLAVHPDFKNKGIGSKLVEIGLKKAKDLGYDSVIAVGNPDYYSKLGFKRASNWNIAQQLDIPDEAFMAFELKSNGLKDCKGIIKYPKEYEEAMGYSNILK